MLTRPLEEEQADMRQRWADPAYRWANDSNIRRSVQGRPREETTERQPTLPSSVQDTSREVEEGARAEGEKK